MIADVDVAKIYRASVQPDGVTPAPAANAHPKLSATGRVVVFDTLAGAAFSPLTPPAADSLRQVVGITQQPQLSIADIDVGTGMVGLAGLGVVRAPLQRRAWLVRAEQGLVDQPRLRHHLRRLHRGLCGSAGWIVRRRRHPHSGHEGRLNGFIKISEAGFGALNVQSKITGAGGFPALSADQSSYHHFETLTVGRNQRCQLVHHFERQPRPCFRHHPRDPGCEPEGFQDRQDEVP